LKGGKQIEPAQRDTQTRAAPHRCGIVLHPAGHTRSPAMHRAAYRALGLDATYSVFDIEPGALAGAVEDFRRESLAQFAVSIPHKEAMLALVDEVDPTARAIGAINTVTRVEGRLVGTNTDWLGALRALERETAIEGRRAVVLGAGGTARALVFGLTARGAEVHVLNRTVSRAEILVQEFGAAGAGPLSALAGLEPDILVNTTSVGLGEDRSPVPSEALPQAKSAGFVVLDAVYSPPLTRLLAESRQRGGRTVGGKWMLVYQAVEQLRTWTRGLPNEPTASDFDDVVGVMAEAFDAAGRETDGGPSS
jgi:shikimate dehydrogenase